MTLPGKVPPRLLRHPCAGLRVRQRAGAGGARYGGDAGAVPLYLLLRDLPLAGYLMVVALLFLVGLPVCTHAARQFGVHDHPAIVWDEIVGYLVTTAYVFG
jgi:phosphatidylglycerophosphatase A